MATGLASMGSAAHNETLSPCGIEKRLMASLASSEAGSTTGVGRRCTCSSGKVCEATVVIPATSTRATRTRTTVGFMVRALYPDAAHLPAILRPVEFLAGHKRKIALGVLLIGALLAWLNGGNTDR